MEIRPVQKLPRDQLERLLLSVPFYKAIKQQDNWQFEVLLQHSRIVCFSPGEVVLQRGERDPWLYFLLKGQLQVYPDELGEGEPVNVITPGEVFGDLSMLVGSQRTATLIADPAGREVMVFASDFRVFGDLETVQPISRQTKITYYRNTVHNLRWKLEVYRSRNPQHSFANKHRQVKLYTGPKGTAEELRALHAQAQALARLLLEWNGEFGSQAVDQNAPLVSAPASS